MLSRAADDRPNKCVFPPSEHPPASRRWFRFGTAFIIVEAASPPHPACSGRLADLWLAAPGVIASGIPSLTRRTAWKALGPWKTSDPSQTNLIDSSLGVEDDMIARFQASGHAWPQAMLMRPVAADILNGALGCKAKVRKGRRYGRYTPPVAGDF